MSTSRFHFKYLDILRFVAAFMVVLGHGFQAWRTHYIEFKSTPEEYQSFIDGNFRILDDFMSNMGLGVEIFFLISGFLITLILIKEKQIYGNISIKNFFIRRALRIWPLYFVLIAIAPFLVEFVSRPQPDYWSNIFFYCNFEKIHSGFNYPFAHFWSIAIEEQFYVIWPFIIAYTPIKYLKYVFATIIAVSITSRCIFLGYHNAESYIYLHTFSRMDTLVIGGWIALAFFNNKIKFAIPKWVSLLSLSIIIYWIFNDHILSVTTITQAIFKKYLFLLLFIPILLWLITEKKETPSTKSFSVFTYLGKISYGLYMIHNIIFLVLIKRVLLNNDLDSWILYTVVYLGVTILLSILSFEYLEKPFLKFKGKFTRIETRKF